MVVYTDPNSCPCLCVDAKISYNIKNIRNDGALGMYKNSIAILQLNKSKSLDLRSSFLDSWYNCRVSANMFSSAIAFGFTRRKQNHGKFPIVVNDLGGQYEESFNDVKLQTINYFTYKAVRTVLHQLYEMNPSSYTWLYNFVVTNDPRDGKKFLQTLAKEKQDLAERVMITRLHLYGKWIKICDHAEIYKQISDENLELLRERLMETVVWPSDDTNADETE